MRRDILFSSQGVCRGRPHDAHSSLLSSARSIVITTELPQRSVGQDPKQETRLLHTTRVKLEACLRRMLLRRQGAQEFAAPFLGFSKALVTRLKL